jgi:hypothetical protein
MRTLIPILCGSVLSIFVGCSTPEPPFVSEMQADARATPVLRIEEQIADMVRTSRDWEMAQFRSYKQKDLDGDGIDDTILLTTFEHGMIWRRELFICLSSSPHQVMHISLGGKGERLAEDFEIKERAIIVRGKTYTDADAMCCPSRPYESIFLVADGKIVERR